MSFIYSVFVVIGTVLLYCDLATGYVLSSDLSPKYMTDKDSSDMDPASLPVLYQILQSYSPSLRKSEDDKDARFEGLLNFNYQTDDAFEKRVNPPFRNWCRMLGRSCRQSK